MNRNAFIIINPFLFITGLEGNKNPECKIIETGKSFNLLFAYTV